MEKIYMDHVAGTSLLPEALESMLPFYKEKFGNPSSIHATGREAHRIVDKARERVARLIGARQMDDGKDEPQGQRHQGDGGDALSPPMLQARLGRTEAAHAAERRADAHREPPITI